MWVLTESGEFVNLDQTFEVAFPWKTRDQKEFTSIIAWAADPDRRGVRLCTCDDEAQARRIIQALVAYMVQGAPVVGISEVKAEVERWLAKERGEASSTATNHDVEYEEWLRRAEEERYYTEYGREA